MACAFGCLGSISAVIVAIQFFAKVVPWLYETIIGPYLLGPKLKLRDYGEWACKYQHVSLIKSIYRTFFVIKRTKL